MFYFRTNWNLLFDEDGNVEVKFLDDVDEGNDNGFVVYWFLCITRVVPVTN